MRIQSILFALIFLFSCNGPRKASREALGSDAPFIWENANIYFLLTDRFANGNPENDLNFGRSEEPAKLRGFMGGDLAVITEKIEAGYFDELGVSAIWLTPFFEQNHGPVDEGTGKTYGFHGYWTQDWTSLDPNFGTEAELAAFVAAAHKHKIRVIMDVIVNHTGPVTQQDLVWPDAWVRTEPKCTFDTYKNTVECTLVANLPDIKTESNAATDLPPQLVAKWKQEGRYEQEMAELDAFFARTKYPRAPRFYIYKWLCDYVKKYGIDGLRCDTAKHTEETVWSELEKEAARAFAEWKLQHPDQVLDKNPFYMVGEVYNYSVAAGRQFDFGDKKVDFFSNGFYALINFDFKGDANRTYEDIFTKYSQSLNGPLRGKSVVNYISSHDDGGPFDKQRKRAKEAGTKLLLCPGAVQIYYGDETARELDIPGTNGDATLRSFMNWKELESNIERNGEKIGDVLEHWQKLGRFRRAHPAVGAGLHAKISSEPYVFMRTYSGRGITDFVLVGLDMKPGPKRIPAAGVFADGTVLYDYYSGKKVKVKEGIVLVDSPFDIVLLGQK
jgi:alpha-amylase